MSFVGEFVERGFDGISFWLETEVLVLGTERVSLAGEAGSSLLAEGRAVMLQAGTPCGPVRTSRRISEAVPGDSESQACGEPRSVSVTCPPLTLGTIPGDPEDEAQPWPQGTRAGAL